MTDVVWKLPVPKDTHSTERMITSNCPLRLSQMKSATMFNFGILLFMICTNDTTLASNLFKFNLYADETILFSALDYSLSLDISASSEFVNSLKPSDAYMRQ